VDSGFTSIAPITKPYDSQAVNDNHSYMFVNSDKRLNLDNPDSRVFCQRTKLPVKSIILRNDSFEKMERSLLCLSRLDATYVFAKRSGMR